MAHSQRNMDDVVRSAIELVLTTNKDDPFPILKELLDRHIINDEHFSTFLHADHANGEEHLWINLSDHLRRHCTIFTLICILLKIGQIELAQRLVDLAEHNRCERRIARVNRVQTDNHKSIRLFFKNLKSQVHDATLKNPREALRCLAERYYRKLNCESNASRQYYFADKLVAILGVEIDAHAITFNDKLSSHALFDELKALVPASSNTMMTDVSYFGRLANANAIGGRFDEGQTMLVKAQYSAATFTSCLEVANMFYIQVYFLLWEFEATGSPQLKHLLLETAEKGIASLQDEDNDIRVLWTRMFLLRMIFCLLGIGNRANILQGFLPSSQDIAQAQCLLQRLRWEGIWNGIETRREMFYWVAMSRLNALQGQIAEAKVNAITAQKLAFSGKFKELTFITSCVEVLERASYDSSHEDTTTERNRHGDSDPETRPYTDSNIAYELNNGLSADSNRTCDYDGLNSYAGQNWLSREYNRQVCCFDFRQMSNDK
ncbi:uncharacterized protein [Argopecten irradians]|uniref:uncharacterized protein n=1 Tax=Argopecten irradians TaxID=31199 RepID=UPI0037110743